MDERTMENEYQWLAICLHEVLLLQHPLYETYDRNPHLPRLNATEWKKTHNLKFYLQVVYAVPWDA